MQGGGDEILMRRGRWESERPIRSLSLHLQLFMPRASPTGMEVACDEEHLLSTA